MSTAFSSVPGVGTRGPAADTGFFGSILLISVKFPTANWLARVLAEGEHKCAANRHRREFINST